MLKKFILALMVLIPNVFSTEAIPPGVIVGFLKQLKKDTLEKDLFIDLTAIMKNTPMSKEKLLNIFHSLDPNSISSDKMSKLEQFVRDKEGKIWQISFYSMELTGEENKWGPREYFRVSAVKLKKEK